LKLLSFDFFFSSMEFYFVFLFPSFFIWFFVFLISVFHLFFIHPGYYQLFSLILFSS